jgi:hypothetical protein
MLRTTNKEEMLCLRGGARKQYIFFQPNQKVGQILKQVRRKGGRL